MKATEVCESKLTRAVVSPHPVGRNQNCPTTGKESIKSSSLPLTDFCATLQLGEKQKGDAILE